jgi:hypothetical protein
LGTWHGKKPDADGREYAIQRALYLYGINLVLTRKKSIYLRPFAYEMPLYRSPRSESIDVVAYDAEHKVYLIEVKRAKNSERLEDAVKQVSRYAEAFQKIKANVEAEFEKQFHFEIVFKGIVKVIVAPRKFYRAEDHTFLSSYCGDVWVGYLGRIQPGDEANLLWRGSATPISVHLIRFDPTQCGG